jgi:cyclopropane-fatty-acyl-phospholipid synthase
VLALARRLEWGTLVIDDELGTRHVCGAGAVTVEVRVRDDRAWAAVLLRGSIGLGESYAQGWWDCDDLTSLLRIVFTALRPVTRALDRMGTTTARFADPVRRLGVTRGGRDRRNVRAHYDISNEFFALMLDPTMTYSCGLFARPQVSLADAQRAKLDRICRLLELSPDDELLEIGSGWGSFAIHAASCYGCRVTTTTISEAQFEVARDRVASAGLTHLITVRPDHYRELTGRYSKVASIEMFEAVGWRDHDEFFEACSRLLDPHGLMALQTIVIEEGAFDRTKVHQDFIKRFIFPGGCLPSVTALVSSAARPGLQLLELHDIGRHYPETLRRWRSSLDAQRENVTRLGLDESFQRMWTFYLCYCEAGFIQGRVSDVQVLLSNRSARETTAAAWTTPRRRVATTG